MKHVPACLCASEDRESNFHLCGSPVKLVQACLSSRKELESSFHHSGGPVKLVQSLFKRQERPIKPLWKHCEACASLFMSGKDP